MWTERHLTDNNQRCHNSSNSKIDPDDDDGNNTPRCTVPCTRNTNY